MQPKFWKRRSLLAILLLPFACLYSLSARVRNIFVNKHTAKIPIICVGNVTVGGAGKTPVVIAISEILQEQGFNVAIASRGYKGDTKIPTLVDRTRHTVNSVGDEPLLLSKVAPTYIAAERRLAIQMAQENSSNIILMDDGMQNPSIKKDLTILVIDGKYGIGNGFIMPAGPLRESLASGVMKADAIVIVGNDDNNISSHTSLKSPKAPAIIKAKLQPFGNLPDKTLKYLAFAGIGNPYKFFSTLAEAGYDIAQTVTFPDHYYYSDNDITQLISKAELIGATLITTEKDEVRLPLFAKGKIKTLPVKIVWEDSLEIKNVLKNIIKK